PALPDAAAAELAPSLVDAGVRAIDLSGAFRLRDAQTRARWYPDTRRLPDGVAYGLTEVDRTALARALPVANPGVCPTAALRADATEAALATVYEGAYADAPFVRLVGASLPEIKHVAHTNFCDVGWRVDAAGRGVLVSVIDNLVKGAAGQAVQNLNVMLGVD